jgi:SAM-dependent methyltransferase
MLGRALSSHAGASPHWDALWRGGLEKGSRFDVGGVSRPLAAELSKRSHAPRSGMTALVPGCGRAYDALALAEHGFATVVAIDCSPAACEAARAELAASTSPAASRVEIRCADFFETDGDAATFDFIWDCTFLCALDPSVREQWATATRTLLAPDGTLLSCVFPIGEREGGPPYALSVPLVRGLLEPLGLEAVRVQTQDQLAPEEQHRRPGDPLESVADRGTALVTWQVRAKDDEQTEVAAGGGAILNAGKDANAGQSALLI